MNNQLDLFTNTDVSSNPKNDLELINSISGLQYIENFISNAEEQELVNHIDESIWLGDLKRRVQHYGYKYDYRKRNIDHSMFLGDIPNWVEKIANRLVEKGFMSETPDQIIVNEYLPGQGIADHIDCEPCFKNSIISLSLCSNIVMQLKEKTNRNNKVEALLEPKSLIVIKDEARYLWTHGIPSRKVDTFKGQKIERQRRISLTFRNVII